MRVLDELLVEASASLRRQSVSRVELDTSIYKFRSRLHDLREELSLSRTASGSELRTQIAQLSTEISQTEHKLNEAVAQLKFELSVEHSNRKAEESELGKALEGKTLDLSQSLAVALADLRTTSETMKIQSTRKLVTYVLLGFITTIAFDQALPGLIERLSAQPAEEPSSGTRIHSS
jgi:TolA-binding protein